MIESANKKKESTRKDRHKNHMQIKQRIPGKENIPEGFSFKKKNVYTSWVVPPLLLECMCFPFRNTTCESCF